MGTESNRLTYGSPIQYSEGSNFTYGGWGSLLARSPVGAEFSKRLREPNASLVFLITAKASLPVLGAETSVHERFYLPTRKPPARFIHQQSGELTELVYGSASWSIGLSAPPIVAAGEWFHQYDLGGSGESVVWWELPTGRSLGDGRYKVGWDYTFSNKAKSFRDTDWDPRLEAIPSNSYRIDEVFGGVGQTGSGQIVLSNADGYFDGLDDLIWTESPLVIEMGIDTPNSTMDESDYHVLGKWEVIETERDDGQFIIRVREQKSPLEQEIPHEIFTREDYPSLDNEDTGKPIPRAYGDIYGAEPVIIDRAARRGKMAHHAIRSFNGVRINKSIKTLTVDSLSSDLLKLHSGSAYVTNESRDIVNVTFDDADLTEVNSKEAVVSTVGSWSQEGSLLYVQPPSGQTITSGDWSLSIEEKISRWVDTDFETTDLHLAEFTLGDDWNRSDEISVDFSGRTQPDGSLMINPADIAADLLEYTGGIRLDEVNLNASRAFYHVGFRRGTEEAVVIRPSLYLNERVNAAEVASQLNDIAGSYLFINNEGNWVFGAFKPTQGQLMRFSDTHLPRLFTDDEIIDGKLSRKVISREVFSGVKVLHSRRFHEDWSEAVEEKSEDLRVYHGLPEHKIKEVEPGLSSKADARYYAQRLLSTQGVPLVRYDFELPWVGMFLMPGDQIRIQRSRPVDHVSILDKLTNDDLILEVLSVKQDLMAGRIQVTAGDRRGWKDTFGHWLGDIGVTAGSAVVPSGAELWLSADQSNVTARGKVSIWPDQSGKMNDLNQGFTGNRPKIFPDYLNGFPVIEMGDESLLTGNTDYFNLPDLSHLSEGELFVVHKRGSIIGSAAGDSIWEMGTSGDPTQYEDSSGDILEDFGTDTRKNTGNPTADLTGWRIYNVISTSAEFTVNIDNVQHYTTATNTPAFPSAGRLGAGVSNLATEYSKDHQVAELFIFPRKLTSTERLNLVTYLSDKYALGVVGASGAPPDWDSSWTQDQVQEARQNSGYWTEKEITSNAEMAKTGDQRSFNASRWY